MTIRDATPADSSEITQLTIELGYAAENEIIRSRLTKIIGRTDHLVLVAIVDQKIVAWLQAHSSDVLESGFRAEIVGLVVSKESRRCGVGRNLVQRAEQWAVAIGAEAIIVRSNTLRVESHGFYPALGFASSKTQAVYRKHLIK